MVSSAHPLPPPYPHQIKWKVCISGSHKKIPPFEMTMLIHVADTCKKTPMKFTRLSLSCDEIDENAYSDRSSCVDATLGNAKGSRKHEGMRKDVCTEHVVSCPVVIEKIRNSSHESCWQNMTDYISVLQKHALGSYLSSLLAASMKLWTTTLFFVINYLAISNCLDMFGYYVFVLHLLSMIVSHSTVHSHRLCYYVSLTIPGVFYTYLMHFIHLNHVIHAESEAAESRNGRWSTKHGWSFFSACRGGPNLWPWMLVDDCGYFVGLFHKEAQSKLIAFRKKHNTTLLADSMLQIGFGLQERSSNNLYKTWDLLYRFCWKLETCECRYWWWYTVLVASMRSQGLWRLPKQSCSVQKKRWNDFRRIQNGWYIWYWQWWSYVNIL